MFKAISKKYEKITRKMQKLVQKREPTSSRLSGEKS